MQQERSYFRRVKCLNLDIYEPKSNARRAYNLVPLAVKTSRPRLIRVQNYIILIYNQNLFVKIANVIFVTFLLIIVNIFKSTL